MKITNHFRLFSLIFVLNLITICVSAQSITVRGTVRDNSGVPMIGVNVTEVGTQNGTITNIEGKYEMKVSAKASLNFSFIGFQTQQVAVSGKNTVNVTLSEDNQNLEEVVVVGYGTQRKEAITGSVASVKGDIVREVPAGNITQALQGRVSGVDMAQTSSKPGTSMQIRIRGTRSLNASNDPLIVLDGIPFAGSISDISPNDIKSIDILKDASATAVYGSRGANGVILITSNKGTKASKPRISYDAYEGTKSVFGKYPMMNGEEFVKLRQTAGIYTNTLDESNDVNTDWQDLLYRPGKVSSHDLGVTGSTETSSYKFGLGYYNDESVLPGQDYSRFNLRSSLDQEIGKYIKVGFTTNSSYAVTNGSNLGLYGTLNSSPIASPYNEDGTWKTVIKMPMEDQWVYSRETVDALGDKWADKNTTFGSYNTLYGEVLIPGVEGLKYRVNLGLNYRQTTAGTYTGQGVFSATPTSPSSASLSNSNSINWAVENILSYDKTIAEKHRLNALVLYSAEQTTYSSSYITAKNIPADAMQFYNLGRAADQPVINPDYQKYYQSGLISGMGRIMYSYDDKYMLSASYRYDGSSRLADGHKWVSYPAVSVGWNMKNESFMSDVDLVNSLKLRMGYGVTSNQSIDPYSTMGLLGTKAYNFGTNYTTGYYVTQLPNPELGWEYSSTMNYAIDFSILKNRLSGTVEYYNTQTNNLLFQVSLPATSGVTSYMANVGKSENKGWEFTLNGTILDNYNGWSWDAGVNIYTNHNKLLALASGQLEDKSNNWFVGSPIDVIYDYKYQGIWQEGDPYLSTLEQGGNVGMIKVEYTGTYKEDGTPTRAIGEADRQVLSMEPDFQGGFNTRVAYKNFDLTVVGAFKSGGILIATPYGSNGYLNILSGRRGNIKVDYWTPENTDARFPKPGGIGGDQPKYLNTLSYMDASYLKFRTITLGYNFDKSEWIKKAGINKMRIYCTAQNPFVMFSPFYTMSGLDPETNSYANENSAVPMSSNLKRLLTIGTNTPSTRNFMVGLNVTF